MLFEAGGRGQGCFMGIVNEKFRVSVGGGGSDLREETREAINYGGDTGYVITQTRKPIDIGRS